MTCQKWQICKSYSDQNDDVNSDKSQMWQGTERRNSQHFQISKVTNAQSNKWQYSNQYQCQKEQMSKVISCHHSVKVIN